MHTHAQHSRKKDASALVRTQAAHIHRAAVGDSDETVLCVGDEGVDIARCIESDFFSDWAHSVQPTFKLDKIEFRDMEALDTHSLKWIMVQAQCSNRATGAPIPGDVFMQGKTGSSAGVMVELTAVDSGERYILLVRRSRLVTGDASLLEIPTGHFDEAQEFYPE